MIINNYLQVSQKNIYFSRLFSAKLFIKASIAEDDFSFSRFSASIDGTDKSDSLMSPPVRPKSLSEIIDNILQIFVYTPRGPCSPGARIINTAVATPLVTTQNRDHF